jgi:hypothetical protein
MTSDNFISCLCSHGHSELHLPPEGPLRVIFNAAQRLDGILKVADMLTEQPELTANDIIALDVLLDAGREQANDIIRQIMQLSGTVSNAEAKSRQ